MAPKSLCIRCPTKDDAMISNHAKNVLKCYKDKSHYKTPTTELWWPFPSGAHSFDFADDAGEQHATQIIELALATLDKFKGGRALEAPISVSFGAHELTKELLEAAAHKLWFHERPLSNPPASVQPAPSDSSQLAGQLGELFVASTVDGLTATKSIAKQLTRRQGAGGLIDVDTVDQMPEQTEGLPTSAATSSIKSDVRNRAVPNSLQQGYRTFVLRPNLADPDSRDPTVIINHFALDVSKSPPLYKYSIEFDTEVKQRTRRKALVRRAIASYPELSEEAGSFVTDESSVVVSWKKLFAGQDVGDFPVDDFKRGVVGTVGKIRVKISFIIVINLQDVHNYCMGKNPGYAETHSLTALNLLLSKGREQTSSDKTIDLGQNKLYWKPSWVVIDDKARIIGLRSYSYSTRALMGGLLLNVDVGMSAFFEPGYLSKYCKTGNRSQWQHLVGLRVMIMYHRGGDEKPDMDTPERRTRTITGFSQYEANATFFDIGDGVVQKPTSVYDYANSTLASDAREYVFDDGVVVNVGSQEKPTWFLATLLWVLPGQLYKRKLFGLQTASMIEHAQIKPEINRIAISEEGLPALGLRHNGGTTIPQVLKDVRINFDSRNIEVPARVVVSPVLKFGDRSERFSKVNARDGKWDNKEHAFIDGSKKPFGTVQFLSSSQSVRRNQLQFYKDGFMNGLKCHGIVDLTITECEKIDDSDLSTITAGLETLRQASQVAIFVLILPRDDETNRRIYADFKTATDQLLGVVSVCINEARMGGSIMKDRVTKIKPPMSADTLAAYFGNITLKVNLRFGNANHGIDTDNTAMQLLRNSSGVVDTLILGIDVTHPGIGSAGGMPSIAAVVGSMDKYFAQYHGAMRYQEARQEGVEYISEMTQHLLIKWSKAFGNHLPSKILVYRDGVDEGQYSAVLKKEADGIRDAFTAVQKLLLTKSTAKPALTFVVVTKRHHTRLYPTVPNDRLKGNCQPGTIVESGITSPYSFDFYLQSHFGLVGTARPTKYTVLENGMKLSARQMQDLTNVLCYTYQRSQSAVSYVTPTYYADHLAERGRAYLKSALDVLDADATEGEQSAAIKAAWDRGGGRNGNPWHPNMDDKMFWL
ncbi:Protein argonaute [Oleoguttula sp. CCFEE 5521]